MKLLVRLGIFLIAILFLMPAITHAVDISFPKTQASVLFSDVDNNAWFYSTVSFCQEAGILKGTSEHLFAPYNIVSMEEAAVIVARLHQKYNNLPEIVVGVGERWSAPYLEYCYANGIISPSEYNSEESLARNKFVLFISRIFDINKFQQINRNTYIPDFDTNTALGKSTLQLYNTGIITGINPQGYFSPESSITRAEIATLIARLMSAEFRVTFESAPGIISFTVPLDLGKVQIHSFDGSYIYGYTESPSGQLWSIYNLQGHLLHSEIQLGLPWRQSNGIFAIYGSNNQINSYYDADGNRLNLDFKRGTVFSDNIAVVEKEDGFHVIDTNGSTVRHFAANGYTLLGDIFGPTGGYVRVQPFSGPNGSSYLMDTESGAVKILPYKTITGFTQGRAVVQKSNLPSGNNVYNIIDTSLNELLPNDFSGISMGLSGDTIITNDFKTYQIFTKEGLLNEKKFAYVSDITADGQCLIKDTDGSHYIAKVSGEKVLSLSNAPGVTYALRGKCVLVENQGTRAVIDLDGKTRVSPILGQNLWFSIDGKVLYIENQSVYYITVK